MVVRASSRSRPIPMLPWQPRCAVSGYAAQQDFRRLLLAPSRGEDIGSHSTNIDRALMSADACHTRISRSAFGGILT